MVNQRTGATKPAPNGSTAGDPYYGDGDRVNPADPSGGLPAIEPAPPIDAGGSTGAPPIDAGGSTGAPPAPNTNPELPPLTVDPQPIIDQGVENTGNAAIDFAMNKIDRIIRGGLRDDELGDLGEGIEPINMEGFDKQTMNHIDKAIEAGASLEDINKLTGRYSKGQIIINPANGKTQVANKIEGTPDGVISGEGGSSILDPTVMHKVEDIHDRFDAANRAGFNNRDSSEPLEPGQEKYTKVNAVRDIKKELRSVGITDPNKQLRTVVRGNNNDTFVNLGLANAELYDARMKNQAGMGQQLGVPVEDIEKEDFDMLKDSVLPKAKLAYRVYTMGADLSSLGDQYYGSL